MEVVLRDRSFVPRDGSPEALVEAKHAIAGGNARLMFRSTSEVVSYLEWATLNIQKATSYDMKAVPDTDLRYLVTTKFYDHRGCKNKLSSL